MALVLPNICDAALAAGVLEPPSWGVNRGVVNAPSDGVKRLFTHDTFDWVSISMGTTYDLGVGVASVLSDWRGSGG